MAPFRGSSVDWFCDMVSESDTPSFQVYCVVLILLLWQGERYSFFSRGKALVAHGFVAGCNGCCVPRLIVACGLTSTLWSGFGVPVVEGRDIVLIHWVVVMVALLALFDSAFAFALMLYVLVFGGT